MYAAFWIDPNATDDNKRVVFCQPFAKKPNTAWMVLRSAIREDRTGGVLSGTEEALNSCIEAIDQKDEGWPDDPDRMVVSITKIATQMDCHVQFRQNVKPDGVADHVASLDGLVPGVPRLVESDNKTQLVVPMVGDPEKIIPHTKHVGGTMLTLDRHPTVSSRSTMTVEYVEAYRRYQSKNNSAGFSETHKIGFDQLDYVLDNMLGPTAKRYRFVLLIRERPNSILFFGTKPAHTVRQAIEQYVDHMTDRQSSSDPFSSSGDGSGDDSSDLFDQITAPAVSDCRLWKL